jgi:hypothetical protein
MVVTEDPHMGSIGSEADVHRVDRLDRRRRQSRRLRPRRLLAKVNVGQVVDPLYSAAVRIERRYIPCTRLKEGGERHDHP